MKAFPVTPLENWGILPLARLLVNVLSGRFVSKLSWGVRFRTEALSQGEVIERGVACKCRVRSWTQFIFVRTQCSEEQVAGGRGAVYLQHQGPQQAAFLVWFCADLNHCASPGGTEIHSRITFFQITYYEFTTLPWAFISLIFPWVESWIHRNRRAREHVVEKALWGLSLLVPVPVDVVTLLRNPTRDCSRWPSWVNVHCPLFWVGSYWNACNGNRNDNEKTCNGSSLAWPAVADERERDVCERENSSQ